MNKKNTVLNGNKLIAEFMGFTPDYLELRNEFTTEGLKYNTDWNWLMPVVEKIEKLGYFVKISTKMVSVARDNKGNNDSYLIKAQFGDDSKLQKTYNCVIETIKYINYLNKKE